MRSGFVNDTLYKLFAHSLTAPGRKNVKVPDSPSVICLQVRITIQAANCDHVLTTVRAEQCFPRLTELVGAIEVFLHQSIKKFKALLSSFLQ